MYHTGEPYGHVYWAPGLALHEWHYDEASGTFGDGARVPQWIILQRSPLIHYSSFPRRSSASCAIGTSWCAAFPVTADGSDRLYDQQDAFFLPLDGLAGIERPGPSYEIYRSQDGSWSGPRRPSSERWLRIALPVVVASRRSSSGRGGSPGIPGCWGTRFAIGKSRSGRSRNLPLVGPATHVHGYTIGPAFYWVLWAIRVVFGPWFENLPHAGGIGQAALQSAVDALC